LSHNAGLHCWPIDLRETAVAVLISRAETMAVPQVPRGPKLADANAWLCLKMGMPSAKHVGFV